VDQHLDSRNAGLAGVTGRLTLRILLLEDDHEQIASLKAILKRIGHSIELTIANCVTQALDLIRAFRPDLLVINLDSEPVEGLIFAQAIEDEFGLQGPDVIALMSFSLEQARAYRSIPVRVVRFERPLSAERLCGYLDALTVKLLAKEKRSVVS
jgi:CheY-like chemotaxis protein